MRKEVKQLVIGLFIIGVFITCIGTAKLVSVRAAETYTAKDESATKEFVTREEFVTMVMKELNFLFDESGSDHPYLDAAIRAGVITEKTFGNKYSAKLTKSDAAVVLVNADEYLHGKSISEELVNTIIEKRISDINKVSIARREYVAKAYALGFLKGNSNGEYSTDRSMKAWQKVSISTAKNLVSLLNDTENRSKISPDGQLLRTTKLPSNAEFYPYILASYPNEYYDWEFGFMKDLIYVDIEDKPGQRKQVPYYTTEKSQEERLHNWAAPVDIDKYIGSGKATVYVGNEFITAQEAVKRGKSVWVEKVKDYLMAAFNINYKTIENDQKWYNTILTLDEEYGNEYGQKITEDRIKEYIELVIENRTIIECDKIAVDVSTLYIDSTFGLMLRCYVHYRVLSANDTISSVRVSPLAFTKYTYPDYDNIKLGEWRNGFFDISVSEAYGNYGISQIVISDYFHNTRVVTK